MPRSKVFHACQQALCVWSKSADTRFFEAASTGTIVLSCERAHGGRLFRDSERILDIRMGGSGVTANIAEQYPTTQFTSVDICAPPGAPNTESISFENNRLTCNGGQFDKVICSMVLHPVSPALKIILLKESRRALRNGGKLYVAEFDAPEERRQGTYLRGISYEYGYQTAAPHLDGKWIDTLEKAGFTHIKRLQTVPEWHSRVSIVRARR